MCITQTHKDEESGAQDGELSDWLASEPEADPQTHNLFSVLHHTLAERKRKMKPSEMTGKVPRVEQNSGQAGSSLFSVITRNHVSEVCVIRVYYDTTSER